MPARLRCHAEGAQVPSASSTPVASCHVYSERLGETVFFCEDQDTRVALVEAGACEWSIYTRDELRILCVQNRIAPLSDADLRQLHDGRRMLNARIVE
jgi:hypothetical protein